MAAAKPISPTAKLHNPIVQAELLQQRFGIKHQRFQFVVALLGPGELEHLDFLKLMLAEDAARSLPAAPASERKQAVQAQALMGRRAASRVSSR